MQEVITTHQLNEKKRPACLILCNFLDGIISIALALILNREALIWKVSFQNLDEIQSKLGCLGLAPTGPLDHCSIMARPFPTRMYMYAYDVQCMQN